jgi:hypothetical protein
VPLHPHETTPVIGCASKTLTKSLEHHVSVRWARRGHESGTFRVRHGYDTGTSRAGGVPARDILTKQAGTSRVRSGYDPGMGRVWFVVCVVVRCVRCLAPFFGTYSSSVRTFAVSTRECFAVHSPRRPEHRQMEPIRRLLESCRGDHDGFACSARSACLPLPPALSSPRPPALPACPLALLKELLSSPPPWAARRRRAAHPRQRRQRWRATRADRTLALAISTHDDMFHEGFH